MLSQGLLTRSVLQLPEGFAVVLCVYNQLTSGVFPSISHRYQLSTISGCTRYFPHENRSPRIRQLNWRQHSIVLIRCRALAPSPAAEPQPVPFSVIHVLPPA
ncbi:unnamed protein product [Pleuronectes platessa]|uniref:Uncharacterized protein n=1 Tax=Pleuronectes platessa TaxID=8262 RepID=A0A9N7UL89_PLEPL|nr:unnamed protein product [Pleuronectes platessa]